MMPGEDARAAHEEVARVKRKMDEMREQRRKSFRAIGLAIAGFLTMVGMIVGVWFITRPPSYDNVACWRITYHRNHVALYGITTTPADPVVLHDFPDGDSARAFLASRRMPECALGNDGRYR